jgi:conjugal transfer pilus assembly protein TraU
MRFVAKVILMIFLPCVVLATVGCVGKMTNPITDVCWKCLFPIHIAGFKVVSSNMSDSGTSASMPLCVCSKPPISIPKIGIPIGFWEPVRLVDVTKSPMCMVSLGGKSLGTKMNKGMQDSKDGSSFYHVHWYIYPVLFWLELLVNFACLDNLPVDVAYLTEFDPLWTNDTKSTILNPEAILFASVPAQVACIADCAKASSGLPFDGLHWCSGCQGSMYPYTGTISAQHGGVQGSVLLVSRMIAKMHRQLMLWATWGKPMVSETCSKYSLPIIKKSAYRIQMTFPVAESSSCKRIGETEVPWQGGREFPINGEDFGYLIWKKRECCLGAL